MRHSHNYDALQQFWQGVRLKNVHKTLCIKINQNGAVSGAQRADLVTKPSVLAARSLTAAFPSLCKNNAAAARKSKGHTFSYRGI
ncbi:hypothetical protein NMA58_07360 [Rhizobium sp. YTUHZ045]|uniref:hypothetical protein n=1 Tax=Rhizobium sp. YTUHZ045 TaxID=2962888 RepID=UPI003DAA3CA1